VLANRQTPGGLRARDELAVQNLRRYGRGAVHLKQRAGCCWAIGDRRVGPASSYVCVSGSPGDAAIRRPAAGTPGRRRCSPARSSCTADSRCQRPSSSRSCNACIKPPRRASPSVSETYPACRAHGFDGRPLRAGAPSRTRRANAQPAEHRSARLPVGSESPCATAPAMTCRLLRLEPAASSAAFFFSDPRPRTRNHRHTRRKCPRLPAPPRSRPVEDPQVSTATTASTRSRCCARPCGSTCVPARSSQGGSHTHPAAGAQLLPQFRGRTLSRKVA